MDKKRLVIIGIIALVIIAIIVAIVMMTSNSNKPGPSEDSGKTKEEEYLENKESIDLGGNENVSVNPDGSTVNNSSSLKKDKKIAGLDITDIDVRYVGKETQIIGTIKNNTGSEINAGDVKVLIKDSKGNTFREIEVYIGKVRANSSKKLDVTTQADISNMKDIQFVK